MKCEKVKGVLDELLNGNLSGEESRSVRLHLASCHECRSMLNHPDRIEILPALDDVVDPSPDFVVRLHSRLGQAQGKRPWKYSWKLASAAAVVLASGLFLGQYLYRTTQSQQIQNDMPLAENLPLLEDMAVIQHLDLLENFDAIENLKREERGEK